jgi:hypothetical protein
MVHGILDRPLSRTMTMGFAANPPQLIATSQLSRLPPGRRIRYGCGTLLAALHEAAHEAAAFHEKVI